MKFVDSKVKSLVAWMEDGPLNGSANAPFTEKSQESSTGTKAVISPKLEVKDNASSGRGLYACAAIAANENIIHIPPSYLLNFSTAVAHIAKHNASATLPSSVSHNIHVPSARFDAVGDFYSHLSLESLMALTSFQILSLYLVLEKHRGPDSFWAPFMNSLPDIEELRACPLIWKVLMHPDADKLWSLLPRSTRKHSESVLARYEKDYNVVSSILQGTSYFSTETFLWAWMCINSRCLYMEIPQAKDSTDNFTLAPYVDFLNHSSDDQCGIKVDSHGFRVFTSSSYSCGDELYFSYGPHSNEFLLCEYGFTLPHNKWNYIDISDYINLLFSPKQTQFLKDNGYYSEYTVNSDGMSFRCEIALATLQEADPQHSKRLLAFIDGISDGSFYEEKSQRVLGRILTKLLKDSKLKLAREYSVDTSSMYPLRRILDLYSDVKNICEKVLNA